MKNETPEGLRPGFQKLLYPNRGRLLVRFIRNRLLGSGWFHTGYRQRPFTKDLKSLKRQTGLNESSQVAYLGCGSDTRVQVAFPNAINIDIEKQDCPPNNFMQADATNLPFDRERFDGVILKAFGGPRSVYREAERILKENGIVLVAENLCVTDYNYLPDSIWYLASQNRNLTVLRTLGECNLGLAEPLSWQSKSTIARKGPLTEAEKAEIERLISRNRRQLVYLLENNEWDDITEMEGPGRMAEVLDVLKGETHSEDPLDNKSELLEALDEFEHIIGPKAKEKILLEAQRIELAERT